MPRVFSSLPCLSWTEKPVTKPKDSEVFECLAYSPCWASAHLQRLFFLLSIPQQSIKHQERQRCPKDELCLLPHHLEQTESLLLTAAGEVLGSTDEYWKCWASTAPAKSMWAADRVEKQATSSTGEYVPAFCLLLFLYFSFTSTLFRNAFHSHHIPHPPLFFFSKEHITFS